MPIALSIDVTALARFCEKWGVRELSLFGSVLRSDFMPGSDLDVLIDFKAGRSVSLFDWVEMIEELERETGRRVDLVDRAALQNPFRKREILGTREVVYRDERS